MKHSYGILPYYAAVMMSVNVILSAGVFCYSLNRGEWLYALLFGIVGIIAFTALTLITIRIIASEPASPDEIDAQTSIQ